MRDDHRLVFVGGLHRSGTTPLVRCLAEHELVSGFSDTGVEEDEGQHLQDVMAPAGSFGGAGRFALDRRSHLSEDSGLATDENGRKLLAQWTPHWDLTRPVLVEKSPPNIVRTRFLQALYPEASFVMIVRHPVVVALSTKKWARATPYRRLLANWFAAHDALVQDASAVRRLHVIKYEHLISAPEPTLARLATFLGLESPIPHQSLDPRRSVGYAREWGSWQASSLPWRHRRIASLVREFGSRAERFGYSMDDLERAGPFPVQPAGGSSSSAVASRPASAQPVSGDTRGSVTPG